MTRMTNMKRLIITFFSEINLDSHSATECLSNSPSTPQTSSTASSPWVFPLGLEDYDKKCSHGTSVFPCRFLPV
jgi:hypothetical protein